MPSNTIRGSRLVPLICPACRGMGFKGRMGLFELLVIDDKIREALRTTRIHHRLAATAYSFYDVLSPEFMHCHSRHEVTEWFSSHGYAQLRFSPETAVV